MQMIRADAMGFFFGVSDAFKLVKAVPRPDLVTIHDELVHNQTVQKQLQERGFRITPEANRNSVHETTDAIITAHRISERAWHRLETACKRRSDTTCPLVRLVHQASQGLAAEGHHMIMIGLPG